MFSTKLSSLAIVAPLFVALTACTIKTTSDEPDAAAMGGASGVDGGVNVGTSDAATADAVNEAALTTLDASSDSSTVDVTGDESATVDAAGGDADAALVNKDGAVSLEAGSTDGASSDGSMAAGNPCSGPEANPNEDREHATELTIAVPLRACVQSATDNDFYVFTTPAAPAQGGYVEVQITDVGTGSSVEATVYAAHNNGEILHTYESTKGASVFAWFGAQPNATYRVAVKSWGGNITSAAPYLVTVKYTAVPDTHEPNDDLDHATPLTLATETTGSFFAGLLDSTNPTDAAWEDFYSITLAAGPVTVTLKTPSDITGQLEFRNTAGTVLKSAYTSTAGSSLVLSSDAPTAGMYYVVVHPWLRGTLVGTGSTVPAFITSPYKLTVTQ